MVSQEIDLVKVPALPLPGDEIVFPHQSINSNVVRRSWDYERFGVR
jgi:hypothetical protein